MTTMDQPDTTAERTPGVPTPVESRWLIALVFVGITLRLLVLLFRGDDLKTDPDVYVGIAQTIVDGNGLCVPGSDQPTAFRPPVYPLLLAGLNLAGLKFTHAAGLINLVSGAVLIIGSWWMARVIGLCGRWPAFAAAAAALDPLLLRYTALPMTESISAGLLTVAMLQILKLSAEQSASTATVADSWPRLTCFNSRTAAPTSQNRFRQFVNCSNTTPRIKTATVAGLCFGLAGLCRPVVFVMCAVVTLALLLAVMRRQGRTTRGQSDTSPDGQDRRLGFVRPACLAVLPAVVAGVVVLPWIVRNAVQFGDFIPATTHGGYTLLLGNNPVFFTEVVTAPGQPAWQGESLDRWQQEILADMVADGVEPRNDVAIDKWNYDRAVRNIRQQPGVFLQACLLRWKRFWALQPSVTETELPVLTATAVAIWYGVLWLGLGGSLFCADFRRSGHIQLLWLAILSFLLLHTFYWTNTRMRAPLTGIIVVLSAVGWEAVFRRLSRGRDNTAVEAKSS
ncbi:MAG TPA: hypothetical protein EYG03_15065 [Planctomycetes bacterium]|nr:hypothetical protein [Planctomycetota bacterium]